MIGRRDFLHGIAAVVRTIALHRGGLAAGPSRRRRRRASGWVTVPSICLCAAVRRRGPAARRRIHGFAVRPGGRAGATR